MPTSTTKIITNSSLDRYGRRGIVVNFFFIILSLPVLMSSAGTVYWVNGWIYFILVLTYEIAYILILMKINPGLLNERGKFIKEGTKFFDKIYAASYLPLSYLILVIAGLDAVRYHWSTMPVWLTFLGLITILFAFYVSLKAISVNSYFECTVLIQKNQKVCQSGPYSVVRHPGYAAGIISIISTSLILGSWWSLIPSTLIAIILVIRTALEDRTLQNELAGYKEYTKTTRYRLFPLIW